MNVIATPMKDLFIIEPTVYNDDRGYFFESYNKQRYDNPKLEVEFVQDNESFSYKGTLRGLHYQNEPYAQTKLVRVAQGMVYDVVVDLRRESSTFGQYFGVMLSSENKKQLFIPHGFAHGYLVLSDTAIFQYKCDQYYHPIAEGGILWNDQKLNINWPLDEIDPIISEKDQNLPSFESAKFSF